MHFTLESKQLTYRLVCNEDIPELFKLHSDPVVMKYIREPDQSESETAAKIQELIEYNKKHPHFGMWLAEDKKLNELVGWFILIELEFISGAIPEIGYRLFPKFWGKGYGSEIAMAAKNYGIDEVGLKEICGVTHVDHVVSGKILEKAGLHYVDQRPCYGSIVNYYELKIV